MPSALALWFVIIEVAFKVGSVRIEPLALDELSVFKCADVLHPRLLEHIRALPFLLAILPLTGVDVFVLVDHYALAMPFAVFPISVVLAYSEVSLLTDPVLVVVFPVSAIGVL